MITVTVDERRKLKTLEALNLLSLPKKKRVLILRKAARAEITSARKNQKEQKSPNGKQWKKRADGKSKKIQIKLARYMSELSNDGKAVAFGWKKSRSARIAMQHHEGHTQEFTSSKYAQEMKQPNNKNRSANQSYKSGGCTKQQARRLKDMGYWVWAKRIDPNLKSRRRKRPGIKWIQGNISAEQAGVILRMMGYRPKKKWKTVLPKRQMVDMKFSSVYDEMYFAVHGRLPTHNRSN